MASVGLLQMPFFNPKIKRMSFKDAVKTISFYCCMLVTLSVWSQTTWHVAVSGSDTSGD